jgi:TatD DNase family protein
MGFASIQEKDITRDMDEQHLSLIDSHFHLRAIEAKGIDPIALLQKMQENNIVGLEIGLAGDDLGMRIERFGHYDGLQFAVGIGPWGVDKGRPSIEVQIAQLEEQLDLYKAAAIGEIGLDNHWKYGTPESQEALLHRQFDLAQDRGLPIIIHNREADEQFIRILKDRSFASGGVFHCYQGGDELAHLAIEKGFFLSFAGPLTYKSNTQMQKLFSSLPLSSLLLETDSPYLSPVPLRGKPNTPLSMIHIYRFAAELRQISVAELVEQIEINYHHFLTFLRE